MRGNTTSAFKKKEAVFMPCIDAEKDLVAYINPARPPLNMRNIIGKTSF